jgi:hypothetical protein
LVFRLDLASDTSHMCYTATSDDSLIAFEIEDQVITRIQVMADKHHYNHWDWCTAMPLSADDLSLANGVALGLAPTEVKDLLGVPVKKEESRWYCAYRLKALNGQERVHPRKVMKARSVRLALEFTGYRLIGFDLQVGSILAVSP